MSSSELIASDTLVNEVATKLLENNEFLKNVGIASYSWVADCLLGGAAVVLGASIVLAALGGSIKITKTTQRVVKYGDPTTFD